MSRLEEQSAAYRKCEINRNKFNCTNVYNLNDAETVNNCGSNIISNKTDNTDRTCLLAKNMYSQQHPYNNGDA